MYKRRYMLSALVFCSASLGACTEEQRQNESSTVTSRVSVGETEGGGVIRFDERSYEGSPWRKQAIEGFRVLADSGISVTCRDGDCVQRTPDGVFVEEGPILPETLTAEYYAAQNVERSREGFEAETKRSLSEAAALCAEGVEQVEVTITLPFLAYDFTKLRGLSTDDPEFQRIRLERQAQLTKAQAPYHALLREVGATPVDWGEAFNFVDVFVDPCNLEKVADLEGVRGVELSGIGEEGHVTGLQQRIALGQSHSSLAGLSGRYGGLRNGSGRVKYGIVEKSDINIGHASFLDAAPGSMNRVVDTDTCRLIPPVGPRRCQLSATTTSATHGTEVASAIFSDWNSGQIPSLSSVLRNEYSRIAPKSIGHFYKAQLATFANYRRAIKESVWDDGVDIINLSQHPLNRGYCKNDSISEIREAAWLARDAGLLFVTIAGNDGNTSGCNVSNFATFPSTLAVGGTTTSGHPLDLDTNSRAPNSSHGSTQVTLAGGARVNTRFIDLMVNYCHHYLAGSGSSGLVGIPTHPVQELRQVCGTSFSAPTIAGAAGLLLHWSWRRGGLNGLQYDPYTWRVLLALMGDGRATSGTNLYSIDPAYGFGNLRLINLDSDLGTTGGWGMRRVNLVQGDTFDISIADGTPTPNAKGWKFAAFIDQDYYGGSPDMTYQLIDKCPVGGGTRVIRTAAKYPLRARMRISNAEAASVFKGCLYVRVRVNHANGIVPLYLADYYYSNGRIIHAAN